MNKLAHKTMILLLGRFIQEYDIDINDKRFSDYDRGLLRTAQDDVTFHGYKYDNILESPEVEAGTVGKPKRTTSRV